MSGTIEQEWPTPHGWGIGEKEEDTYPIIVFYIDRKAPDPFVQ